MPASLNKSLIFGPIPSMTVRSSAFLMANPAAFAATKLILAALGAALGLALGFAAVFGFGAGDAFITGAGTGAATVAAGTSAILAAGGVGVWLVVFCDGHEPQHLRSQQCASHPSNAPNKNHQKQHPNELSRELIFTPQLKLNDGIR